MRNVVLEYLRGILLSNFLTDISPNDLRTVEEFISNAKVLHYGFLLINVVKNLISLDYTYKAEKMLNEIGLSNLSCDQWREIGNAKSVWFIQHAIF